jgi:hypothetical protein
MQHKRTSGHAINPRDRWRTRSNTGLSRPQSGPSSSRPLLDVDLWLVSPKVCYRTNLYWAACLVRSRRSRLLSENRRFSVLPVILSKTGGDQI